MRPGLPPYLHAAEFALQGLDVLLAVEHVALQAAHAGLVRLVGCAVAFGHGAAFGERSLRGGQGAAFVGQLLLKNHATAAVGAAGRGCCGHGLRCGRTIYGGLLAAGGSGALRSGCGGNGRRCGARPGGTVAADSGQVGTLAAGAGFAAVAAVTAGINGAGGCAEAA